MPRRKEMLTVPETCKVPVICLHGLFESPAIWRPVRQRLLRSGHKTYALPLPGHRRDAPNFWLTRTLLAGCGLVDYFAMRIAQKTGGRPAALLGHSMGGLLALLVAQRFPSLVDRIMIIGAPHAGHTGHSHWIDRRVLADVPFLAHVSSRVLVAHWLANPRRFEDWMRKSLAPGERIEHQLQMMRRELHSGCPYAMREMVAWLRAQNALEAIGGVGVPVSVMLCAKDPIVTPLHQMDIVRALPHATACVLSCGHLPMLTTPRLFERTVVNWISSHEPCVTKMRKPARAQPVGLDAMPYLDEIVHA